VQQWLTGQGIGPDRAVVYVADVRDTDALVAAATRCLVEQGLPRVVIAATFHAFIHPMRLARQGTLVGVASVAAIRGLPGHGGYCGSKAAVVAYCESLRGELCADGLKVVTLVPGFVDTPLTRENRYPMPFLVSPDAFARQALPLIARGRRFAVVPWPMAWVVVLLLLRVMPRGLYDRLIVGRGRKQRRGDAHE
jgi:short-subunit dehydrogenase